MNLRINGLTEEIIELSRLLQKNLKYYFNRSTYCYINFNITGGSDLGLIQIFYSEKSGFFSAKHQDRSVIRYAFGKYDKLTFQLAKDKSNPLKPLFIFDFPLDYSKKTYDAVFAKINRQFHILSKLYKLSEKDIEILNYSYKVYPIEGKDYALFDFGSFKHPKKFLKYLEEVVDELDFALSPSNELFIKPYSIKSITKRDSVDSKYKYCMVCGHKLENTINLNLLEFSRKFPARCESCLEKIYALNLYYDLDKEVTSSKMVYLSDLTNLWDEEGLLGYNMKLLSKFEFLKPFHDDIYKLYPNENIIRMYSPLLNPIEKTEEENNEEDEELKRLLGLDEDEKRCKFCGKTLVEDDDEDICSDCIHKQNAIPQIHKLLKFVKPGTAFTKSSIINKGLKSYDLDIVCSYLVDLELLHDDRDDLLILESKSALNDFIRQYSDDEEDLIQDDVKEVEKVKIKNSQLNEYTIDRAINLIDFIDNVECTYIREFDEWEVLFKRDGVEHTFQVYDNPFEAKLAAIKYLEKINVVEIILDEDSPFILDDEEKSHTVAEDDLISTPTTRICEVCDKEFMPRSKYNPDQKYCDECNSRYDSSEKQVLIGIKKGIYSENIAIKIDNYLKEGYTKSKISKKLGLKNSSLINPIIKFLLPENVPNEPSEITNNDLETRKDIKKCPICDKEVSNINKTYCDDCTEKYNTAQRKALIGIKNGIYNKKMAQEMQSLLDNGYSKTEVSKKYNISNTTYIDPIIDYLLDDYDFPFELDSSKRCPICGNKVSRDTKVYCDECTIRYTSPERRALVGINQGLFTKKLAREMLNLKKEGKNNSFIAKKVKLPDSHTPVGSSLVNPIIKFLLIDEVGEETLKSLKVIKDDSQDEKSVTHEPQVEETIVPTVKTCLVCGKDFAPKCSNGSDVYCSECKSKYTHDERLIYRGIRDGTITIETAKRILKLQKDGRNNKEITDILKLPKPSVVPHIVRILLPQSIPSDGEDEKQINICVLCEQKFIPKSSNGSDKFCPECKKKHTTNELYVLLGVKEGKYTKELANQLIELQNDGLTNKKIGNKLGINSALVNPIIKFFENEEEYGISQEESEIDKTIHEFNESNGVIIFRNTNQWYIYHEKELISIFYSKEEAYKFWSDYLSSLKGDIKPHKHLFENNEKIILKGIISDEDYSELFSFISLLDCDLNKLTFNKLENEDYEIFIDFNLKDYDIPLTIRKLESMGWQKK